MRTINELTNSDDYLGPGEEADEVVVRRIPVPSVACVTL